MNRLPLLVVSMLCLSIAESIAETSLAHRFSNRFKELDAKAGHVRKELAKLPDIPQDDSGKIEAYAKHYVENSGQNDGSVDWAIRFVWPEPAKVDLVALVPSRKLTQEGLDPEYGFPDDYEISLIDDQGDIIGEVARIRATASMPVARGLPYLHSSTHEIKAQGVELRITRLRPAKPDGPPIRFFALSEIFCFSGKRNLMRNAEISFNYDPSLNSSPFWSPDFMIDEFTPLGLPEQPLPDGESWSDIGWISQGRSEQEDTVWIMVDLGRTMTIDGVRLFPARRPSLVTVPGFGLPPRYRIEASTSEDPDSFHTLVSELDTDLTNPGNNPSANHFEPTEARFVRLTPKKLWKPFQYYPAFLASSEFQVLKGEENLALGAKVSTSENNEPFAAHGQFFWSKESLTDGHGPGGEIVDRRVWLERLGLRKTLETEYLGIAAEMTSIDRRWQLGLTSALWILGIIGLIAITILPLRFRIRERRKIRTIRDRIAGDLHDDVGSNLGSIQLLAGAAQTKIVNKDELRLIEQVAAETVSSVRDIVWLLRPKPGERVSTIAHLRESASFMLDSIDWELTTEIDDFAVSDEDGRNLILYFREALHNLIRHSGAENAEIRIRRQEDELCLEIEDDGCGIPEAKLEKASTLRALKQRSKSLGGRLVIESETGKGTVLTLTFKPQPSTASRSLRYPFPGQSQR